MRAVSSAGIDLTGFALPAPDDHFTPGPDCGVIRPGIGRISDAGGCPRIGAGIVSSASVKQNEISILSTPNDHFAAGPDCPVTVSGIGRVSRAGGRPTIGAGIISPAGIQNVAVQTEV